MTRPADITPPAVTPHGLAPSSPVYDWRWRPLIALEYLPAAAYVWDDTDPAVVWDAPGDTYVWDAPFIGAGFTDAVCDWMALDIEPGDPDELYLFPPATATVTLDNGTGAYTPWSADGRLVYWAPGRRLQILAWRPDTDEQVWLFSGRVASWTLNTDNTVTVVAYDGLSWLAQPLGGDWTIGAPGDTVAARITAATLGADYPDRVDIEPGTVTLAAVTDDQAPLEHIERVALSDGGLFYGDADGSLDYRNRLWRAGRDDQPTSWAVSDNRCTVPVVVWGAEFAADDERLVTDVHLVNTTGLTATAALGAGSPWAGDARYRLTHPDPDLWQTQAQGDDLADYLLTEQSTPSMALASFELHARDPNQQPAVWDMAAGVRRGDRVNVLHDFTDPAGNPATLDTWAIVLGVGHTITPESWVSRLALSRTVDYRPVIMWDASPYTWDDPDPANVWRY